MRLKLPFFVKTRDKSYSARIKGISSVSLLSIALVLSLSAIYSGVGIAKADSVIATIPVSQVPAQLGNIAFDSANGNLYVINLGEHTVSVISGETNQVIGNPIPVGRGGGGIAFDSANGNLYVTNNLDNTVTVISGSSNTVIATIPVGFSPRDIAFDSANGNLYVANFGNDTVSVISGLTNTVIGNPISVSGNPQSIAFDSANGNLYTANIGGGQNDEHTVSVISGETNKVIGAIPTGSMGPLGAPILIAFNAANGNLYVVRQEDSGLIISGKTNTVIGVLNTGLFSGGIAIDSANGNVYVDSHIPSGSPQSGFVNVISGQTNTIIGTIIVGPLPTSIAFDSANGNVYVVCENTVFVISTVALQSPDTTITSAIDGNNAPVQNGGTTFSTAVKFTFTGSAGTNPVAGFECSLDNGTFSSCSSRTTLTNLAIGSHTFQVRAVDTSGNRDPTPASFSWKIAALYPPSHTTITSAIDGNGVGIPDGGTTLSSSITFAFTATAGTNPIAGFQCSLDNSPFSSCNSPASFNNLAAGPHRFIVAGVDSAGNKDPMPASFSWTILTPAQGIEQLIQTINGMHLNPGTQTSLDAQLNGILTTLSLPIKNNLLSTCPHLNAFVNTVVPDYLHSGQLNPNQAAQIIQSAQNIQKALGCTGNGH